jgi:HK97 family phage major capsid protein
VWGEDTAATEVDPVLSTSTSNTTKYNTGVVFVTLEELQDSYFDIDAFLRDLMGQRLYRGLAKYISQGSSDGSFVTYASGAPSAATSASPTAIAYADILALYGSIDPAYLPNATFVMNSTTRTSLLGVVDTTGRPLFQPALSDPAGANALGTLLGKPVNPWFVGTRKMSRVGRSYDSLPRSWTNKSDVGGIRLYNFLVINPDLGSWEYLFQDLI